MNLFQKLISKLFFKYCFHKTKSAQYLMCYYIPNTIKRMNGMDIDGKFLFGHINKQTEQIDSIYDISWRIPAGSKRGILKNDCITYASDFNLLEDDINE